MCYCNITVYHIKWHFRSSPHHILIKNRYCLYNLASDGRLWEPSASFFTVFFKFTWGVFEIVQWNRPHSACASSHKTNYRRNEKWMCKISNYKFYFCFQHIDTWESKQSAVWYLALGHSAVQATSSLQSGAERNCVRNSYQCCRMLCSDPLTYQRYWIREIFIPPTRSRCLCW
jgi:hypothetical protein